MYICNREDDQSTAKQNIVRLGSHFPTQLLNLKEENGHILIND
jgi:hypothetical protein